MPTARGVTRSRKKRNEKANVIAENIRQCFGTTGQLLPETGDTELCKEPSEASIPFQMPPIRGESLENCDKDKVFLTHFVSSGEFYIQDESEQYAHRNILTQLQNLFKDRDLKGVDKAVLGKVYALQQSDNSWERCKILNLDSSNHEAITVQLIDVGTLRNVLKSQLFELDTKFLEFPSLAKCCKLWGLCPAGDFTKWSKASTDHALRMFKSSTAYIKVYHTDGEQESEIKFVRLFFEQLKQLCILEYEQYVTTCFNDFLFGRALALKQLMPVTAQPLNGWPKQREIPDHFVAIPVFIDDDAVVHLHPVGPYDQKEAINELLNWHYGKIKSEREEHWVTGQACVVKGLLSHVKKLKSREEADEIRFYRATIFSADDKAKEAVIFLIDYAKFLMSVKYENLHKRLVGFEYAPQAWRCRLLKYPRDVPIGEDELRALDEVLLNAQCSVSVRERKELPLIDIHLQEGFDNGYDMTKVFKILRPDTPNPPAEAECEELASYDFVPTSVRTLSSGIPTSQCRRPNPLSLQSDSETEAVLNGVECEPRTKYNSLKKKAVKVEPLECRPAVEETSTFQMEVKNEKREVVLDNDPLHTFVYARTIEEPELEEAGHSVDESSSSSETESDESYYADDDSHDREQFHFDGGIKKIGKLDAPLGKLLPLRVLKVKSKRVWIQPARYHFNEGPKGWEDHFENTQRLYSEMQRAAPDFPDIKELKLRISCACLLPNSKKWIRGCIVAIDGSRVRVSFYENEARKIFVPRENLKQLPVEYISVPKSIINPRLYTRLSEKTTLFRNLPFLRKLVAERKKFYGLFKLVEKPGDDREEPHIILRYEDEHGNLVSAVDGVF